MANLVKEKALATEKMSSDVKRRLFMVTLLKLNYLIKIFVKISV